MGRAKNIIMICAVVFAGCVSEFKADLDINDQQLIVIEGDIIENTDVDIIVSKLVPLEYDDPGDEDLFISAEVYITGSDGYMSEVGIYMGQGLHRIHVGTLNTETLYSLVIKYNGDTYKSHPQKPTVTPQIEELSWVQPSTNGDVSMRISTEANDETTEKYFMWDFIEEWEYTANFFMEGHPLRCWNRKKGNEILVGTTEVVNGNRMKNHTLVTYKSDDLRFNVLYMMKLKQIAITKEAYEYFLQKKKMSDDMGGLFSPQPAEIYGNIVCETDPGKKTVGFINVVKGIRESAMFIKGDDISKELIDNCTLVLNPEITPDPHNYIEYNPRGDQQMYVHRGCVDCTFWGGTPIRPDYWPTEWR